MKDELTGYDALALRELIENGEVKATE